MSPIIVAMSFPKKGEAASRKQKRLKDDRIYKRIRKLKNEKEDLKRTCNSLRKQISRSNRNKETLNSKTNRILRIPGINPKDAPQIKKQLMSAEALSAEIREVGKES